MHQHTHSTPLASPHTPQAPADIAGETSPTKCSSTLQLVKRSSALLNARSAEHTARGPNQTAMPCVKPMGCTGSREDSQPMSFIQPHWPQQLSCGCSTWAKRHKGPTQVHVPRSAKAYALRPLLVAAGSDATFQRRHCNVTTAAAAGN